MQALRGPRDEKRPADANARADMIAKIATGEIEEAEERAGCCPNSSISVRI
jgi:hypothetical protein